MSFVKPPLPQDRNVIPEVRSGQTVGEGFLPSLIAATVNMTQQPFYMILAAIFLLSGISTITSSTSIFEILYKICSTKASAGGGLTFLYGIFAKIFFTANTYIVAVSSVGILIIPLLFKPSRKNLFVFAFFIFLVLLFNDKGTFVEALLAAATFYYYTQFRDPVHKFIVFSVFLAVSCLIMISLVQYDEQYDSAGANSTLIYDTHMQHFRFKRSQDDTGYRNYASPPPSKSNYNSFSTTASPPSRKSLTT